MASLRVLVLLGCFGLFGVSKAAIEGMPRSGCNSIYPQHYEAPQDTAAPYVVSSTADGDSFRVTIETEDPDTYNFRGFVIQGLVDGVVRGRFSLDEGESEIQLFECPNGDDIDNTATHVSNSPKYSIALTYHPPAGVDPSAVSFRSTIVRVMLEYWFNIPTPLVTPN